jgi:integrase
MASRRAATAKRKHGSYSTGDVRENRVRVYERPGYGIWIDYRDEHGVRVRRPLGGAARYDQEEAKATARDIAAKFGREAKRQPVELTLGKLCLTYEREVTPGKSGTVQEHDRRAFELFLRFFGGARKPSTLSVRDLDAYVTARRSGKLRPPKAPQRTVRNRVLEQDLSLLNAILNWAVKAGDGRGGYLLARNPLKGLPIPEEASPKRARLTREQYDRVRRAAAAISARLEAFAVVAWHTGHRSNSIRQLRWSDVDLERGRVHWRGEADKIGLDHWNPLHPEAVAVLRAERARVPAIGDAWIFPAARDATQPLSRDAVANLWKRVAVKAELPTGERYGWHSCRRAFANRLRRAPLRDLKDLGGWKATKTLVDVYLQPDEDAQREVLETEPGTASATVSEVSAK